MISRLCILALILALHAVADDKITTGTQEAAKELWTGTVLTRANSDPTLLPQILTVYFRSQKDPDVYPRLLTPEEELLSIQREIKSNLNAVGTYGNDYYGQIEINEHSGSLWMRFPDTGALYTLSHWDGDTFTYRFEAEQAIGTRGIVFTFAGIPSVLVENLQLEGNGVFPMSAQGPECAPPCNQGTRGIRATRPTVPVMREFLQTKGE